MNHSNSSTPRATLKLKVAPRPCREARKAPQVPERSSKAKPGAHWSDEYKARMQADMDLLRGAIKTPFAR
jgi:hypothetical protein